MAAKDIEAKQILSTQPDWDGLWKPLEERFIIILKLNPSKNKNTKLLYV